MVLHHPIKFSQVKPLCVLRGEGARAETFETFASLGAQEHLKVGKSSHLPATGVLCCPGMEADPNWKEFTQSTQTVTHPELAAAAAQAIHRSPGVPRSPLQLLLPKGTDTAKAPSQSSFPSPPAWAGQGMLRAQPQLQLLHRFIKHRKFLGK